jgi:hypothetical protein
VADDPILPFLDTATLVRKRNFRIEALIRRVTPVRVDFSEAGLLNQLSNNHLRPKVSKAENPVFDKDLQLKRWLLDVSWNGAALKSPPI